MRYKIKLTLSLAASGLLFAQPVWAAGPPEPSVFSNPLAVSLLVLMLLLLIVIGVLANILIGAADYKAKKRKQTSKQSSATAIIVMLMLLSTSSLFAQDTVAETATSSKLIGGLAASTFYVMITVLFLELVIILGLLANIKILLKKEKIKIVTEPDLAVAKEPKISWWSKFNRFKPVEQEADIDLGHNYDGIRELDNRLPPWWLYGFYLTIIFAVIYLWRFHVSHTGPSSIQEYERSVAKAELKIQDYLKQKGEAVDENTVTLLTGADDLATGKAIYIKSCASCHTEKGGGLVGPNLTDDYWLHGGDVKSIFKIVRYGFNAMPQWQNQYSNKEIAQVTSYIKSLKGTNPPNPKAPEGTLYKEERAAEPPIPDSTAGDKKLVKN
jgi:cytochrome c oxidase cbb3-type subunit 3